MYVFDLSCPNSIWSSKHAARHKRVSFELPRYPTISYAIDANMQTAIGLTTRLLPNTTWRVELLCTWSSLSVVVSNFSSDCCLMGQPTQRTRTTRLRFWTPDTK